MKPIYLDITNIPELDHYTGISRVVTELIMRLLGDRLPLRLLSYSAPKSAYRIIDNERFLLAVKGLLDKRESYTDEYLAVEDFEDGATFLDINSAWHTLPNRSWLLPKLKSKQIRILVQIYDLIPIRYPQYMVGQTLLRFMEYLTAHLTYADAVIVNTHAVEVDVMQLFAEMQLPEKPVLVMPLGADFTAPENQKTGESVDTELLQKLAGRKFLLTVGTVEPRKNHKVLISCIIFIPVGFIGNSSTFKPIFSNSCRLPVSLHTAVTSHPAFCAAKAISFRCERRKRSSLTIINSFFISNFISDVIH